MISIPPHVTISRLIQRMKGKSSYRLLAEFPHMRKRFWGRHVWARGYFCRSSGNVTDEVIKAYIAQQSHDSDDVFRNEGDASPAGAAPLGHTHEAKHSQPLPIDTVAAIMHCIWTEQSIAFVLP